MLSETQAQLELPSNPDFLDPALEFALAYARQLRVSEDKCRTLRAALESALFMVMETNRAGRHEDPILLEVEEDHGKLRYSLLNRGIPIFAMSSTPFSRTFHEMAKNLDRISITNLGRQGQQIILELAALPRDLGASPIPITPNIDTSPGELTIRPLLTGEENQLSQLFYSVYGYHYINEFVYYPDKIKALVESGKLLSTVATLPDGKLVGHVGLLRMNESPPVYEACLGVVDPTVKSRGIFSQIFRMTMEQVQRTPMQYCFIDFVTNHDFTQRFVAQFNPCDLGLLIGCQSKTTQAKLEKLGLGPDPEKMNRYSLLASLIPRTEYPFGREIFLPEFLGEQLGFLLEPLHLLWSPSPRFDPLPPEGEFKVQCQPAQDSVIFDFFEPGRHAAERLIETWQDLMKNGYQYAGIDIPLNRLSPKNQGKTPGLGPLYNFLCSQGFFIGGFLPYHYSDQLALRLQAIAPTEVAFDQIKVHSNASRALLEIIQRDQKGSLLYDAIS